jgi:hypothetical protein
MMMSASPSAISSIWALSARADPKRSEDRTAIFASGESRYRFLRHTLHAGAHGGQLSLHPADRAGLRHRLGLPALVADEAFEEPVFHHPRVAVIAADLRPQARQSVTGA